jgi:hypothetical protein
MSDYPTDKIPEIQIQVVFFKKEQVHLYLSTVKSMPRRASVEFPLRMDWYVFVKPTAFTICTI